MKVLIQRVNTASVHIEQQLVAEISSGLLLLVGFGREDDSTKLKPLAKKIANMRIFPDDNGRFHHSVLELSKSILAVPQFTLFADTSKGRRPEFFKALEPNLAEPLFNEFIAHLKDIGVKTVQSGKFGAHMNVSLENDGPVTIMLES